MRVLLRVVFRPAGLPLDFLRDWFWLNRTRFRGTQRQFSENMCSEDDLRFRISNICCKISCLPASPRIFEHVKNGIIAHF